MFRFVGTLLGHAKLLTVAGLTASTVAIAPVAAHAFQSERAHTPDQAAARQATGRVEQNDFHDAGHQGDTRACAGHDRFSNGRPDHDHFGRRSSGYCETHFHSGGGGHRGLSR